MRRFLCFILGHRFSRGFWDQTSYKSSCGDCPKVLIEWGPDAQGTVTSKATKLEAPIVRPASLVYAILVFFAGTSFGTAPDISAAVIAAVVAGPILRRIVEEKR